MANRMATLLSSISQSEADFNLRSALSRPVTFLQSFAGHAGRLEQISLRGLAHLPISTNDLAYLNQMIEVVSVDSYTGVKQFNGWYPSLFYRMWGAGGGSVFGGPDPFDGQFGADMMDGLVADVHTDLPCPDCGGDEGSVLHEAVGYVNLLMIAVQRGDQTFVCAGPVLSHYEFELTGSPQRMTDSQFRGVLGWFDGPQVPPVTAPISPTPIRRSDGRLKPQAPPWTRSYLVPAK